MSALVCEDCHNKVFTNWLKQQKCYYLTVLEATRELCSPLTALGKDQFQVSSPPSALPVAVCLHPHVLFSEDTSHTGLDLAPYNLILMNQLHLQWPSFQVWSHSEVLGVRIQTYGGHNSIQNNALSFSEMSLSKFLEKIISQHPFSKTFNYSSRCLY